MPLPVFLLWLLLVWASGWFAFPLVCRVLGHALPDGGLAVGRIGFIVAWGLLAFWFGFMGVPVAISTWFYAPLAILGLWFWNRNKGALKTELRKRRLAILSVETVFLCLFLTFFALRSYWSDTNGNNGEKSMDSALIGTLLRAQRLPPENPYSAGARLSSYYIFGHLETALLTRASNTTARWSYNLMCATLPALCFSALFSLGAGLTRRLDGGVFVSGTVLGLGTLQPIIQWLRPGGILEQPNTGIIRGLNGFDTSRVIPFSINEYPWFTFNQSDLHAHYFDFPIEISLMALAWAIFHAPNERKRKVLMGVSAFFLAAQILTNTWDFVAYSILMGLTLFLAPRHVEKPKSLNKPRALALGATLAGAIVFTLPYLLGINTAARTPTPLPQPASLLREWLVLWGPILATWLCVCAWSTFRFDKRWRWAIGVISIAVVFIAVFGQQAWDYPAELNIQPTPPLEIQDQWHSLFNPARLVIPIILLSAFLTGLGAYFNRGLTRFLPCLALAGLFALLWSETTWAGFLGDPTYIGFADSKRQDTVFKFGMQVWMLWGTAAAAGAYLTMRRWPLLLRRSFIPALAIMALSSLVFMQRQTKHFGREAPDGSWRGRQYWDAWAHMRPAEQEAAAWLQQNTTPQQNILEAEQKEGGDYTPYTRYTHATGIATVIGPLSHSFQWSPSSAKPDPSKLPPITPDHPQITAQDWLNLKAGVQWDDVYQRKNDARTAYTTQNAAARLDILKKYNVRYVIWGQLEREQYGEGAQALLARDLKPVAKFGFDSGDDPVHRVEIFEVPGSV